MELHNLHGPVLGVQMAQRLVLRSFTAQAAAPVDRYLVQGLFELCSSFVRASFDLR
jgi:hypothetical protein